MFDLIDLVLRQCCHCPSLLVQLCLFSMRSIFRMTTPTFSLLILVEAFGWGMFIVLERGRRRRWAKVTMGLREEMVHISRNIE